jgi:selenocysteine-specific elongation factor
VTDDIYLHADVAADMRARLTQRFTSGAGLTVAEIRDLLGTTRNTPSRCASTWTAAG